MLGLHMTLMCSWVREGQGVWVGRRPKSEGETERAEKNNIRSTRRYVAACGRAEKNNIRSTQCYGAACGRAEKNNIRSTERYGAACGRAEACGPHPNDPLQEREGLINGGVRIEAVVVVLELVMQDHFQALCQALCLLLQTQLLLVHGQGILLQLLILPAPTKLRGSFSRFFCCHLHGFPFDSSSGYFLWEEASTFISFCSMPSNLERVTVRRSEARSACGCQMCLYSGAAVLPYSLGYGATCDSSDILAWWHR